MAEEQGDVDPKRVARKIGSELAPAAKAELRAMLVDPLLPEHLRASTRDAHNAIEALLVEIGHLEHALESRLVIEQAKGLLFSTGLSMDEAFDLLRRSSQHQNRKLREVAIDLIRTRGEALDALRRPSLPLVEAE